MIQPLMRESQIPLWRHSQHFTLKIVFPFFEIFLHSVLKSYMIVIEGLNELFINRKAFNIPDIKTQVKQRPAFLLVLNNVILCLRTWIILVLASLNIHINTDLWVKMFYICWKAYNYRNKSLRNSEMYENHI